MATLKKKNQGSFWTSFPGVLTGLGTLITALTGLFTLMHSQGASQVPSHLSSDQALVGDWYGKPDRLPLILVLHFAEQNSILSATLDSPCQKVNDLVVHSLDLSNGALKFAAPVPGAPLFHFEGRIVDGRIEGDEWQEGWMASRVTFTRNPLPCPH